MTSIPINKLKCYQAIIIYIYIYYSLAVTIFIFFKFCQFIYASTVFLFIELGGKKTKIAFLNN